MINLHLPNKTQFRDLLEIIDPEKTSIYSVVGRMEILLDFFQRHSQYRGLIPFLKTYYYVTKLSAEKAVAYKRFFWSFKEYEILDVYFASLYFNPLFAFLEGKEYRRPWSHYFHYCTSSGNSVPFLQVLLGINAHINTDLYTTLVDLKYKNQKDFFLVNDILQEVMPDVMHYLVFSEHDLFGLSGLIWKDFAISEFHNVIERWRSEAWSNALMTTPSNHQEMQKEIVKKTEQIAAQLITDFAHLHSLSSMNMLLRYMHTASTLHITPE